MSDNEISGEVLKGDGMFIHKKHFYFFIMCGLSLVLLFQNCGNKEPLVLTPTPGGPASLDVKIFNSTSELKSCFEVGQPVNITIASNPSGRTIQYSLKRAGSVLASEQVTTPYTFQKMNLTNSNVGEFSLLIEVKDGTKTVNSKTYNYSVKPQGECGGGMSCTLEIPEGTSLVQGQTVTYKITSNPAGAEASIEKSETGFDREILGFTPVSVTRTINDSGTLSRAAYMKTGDGVLTKCEPSIDLTVGAPGCAGATFGFCSLASISNGSVQTGTCAIGSTGSCSATCSSGSWTAVVNNCVAATPPPAGCAANTINNCVLPSGNNGAGVTGSCNSPTVGVCTASCSNTVWTVTYNSCVAPTPTPAPSESTWNYYGVGGSGGGGVLCSTLAGKACGPIGSIADCYNNLFLPNYQMYCGVVPTGATGTFKVQPNPNPCQYVDFGGGYYGGCSTGIKWASNPKGNTQLFYQDTYPDGSVSQTQFLFCKNNPDNTKYFDSDPNDFAPKFDNATRKYYLFDAPTCTPLVNPNVSGAFAVSAAQSRVVVPYVDPYDPYGNICNPICP